jgi:hypothetical protein
MYTHTGTHTSVVLANPYLQCGQCGAWVTAFHLPEKCGCESTASWYNVPCLHQSDSRSACMSWGPVDGCQCNPVRHGVPPLEVAGGKTL